MRNDSRWGIPFPIVAAVLIGACFLIVAKSGNLSSRFFESIVPWTGLVLSLLCFMVGHLSYPRIHNLKVYLAGYLVGLTGVAYFVVHDAPQTLAYIDGRDGFRAVLYLLVFGNLIAIALVPAFVKYHVTKYITWAVTATQLGLLAAATTTDWFGAVSIVSGWRWLGPVCAAAVLALTIRFVREQFYLGGVLTGTALFYAVAWAYANGATERSAFESLCLAISVLFFEVGILFHWFVRMEHRIAYDPLLHIYNRDYCSRILAEQSKLNVAPPFTIAMIDIDHFKKVNDTYGHQAGDQVLYTVAQTISRVVVPEGTLCRYGGEELAVFFPQHDAKQVRKVMEEARKAIEKTKVTSGRKHIAVTVSCGISSRTEAAQPLPAVLATADKALYRAKQGGRNQVRTSATRHTRRR
ncbi:MAG: diguanylate cyclase [Chitinivibrionales bacterium]|nr:diguanylate cyclase [Chitinivibrionales bacterium]